MQPPDFRIRDEDETGSDPEIQWSYRLC